MKKINTREELNEMLKNMRALEVVARDSYKKDILLFETKEIKETLKKIELDEEKHIKILDYLILFSAK